MIKKTTLNKPTDPACFLPHVTDCALCKALECWQLFKGIVANGSGYGVGFLRI